MEFDRFDLLHLVVEGHARARYDLSSSDMTPTPLEAVGGLPSMNLAEGHIGGLPELRRQLAKLYGGAAEDYAITHGASEANFAACAALLRPGDPVLVERPYYQPLVNLPRGLGGRVTFLERTMGRGFRVNRDAVVEAMPPGLRLLILSNLHNPSGAPLEAPELKALADLADAEGFYILIDEIFRETALEKAPPTMGGMNDHIVVTGGLSKFYGVGALRIGWARAAPEVRGRIRNILDHTTVAPSAPAEWLSLSVLRKRPWFVERNRRVLEENRTNATLWVEETPGVEWVAPRGSLAFPKVPADTKALARELLDRHGTFIAPGEAFGLPGHFRLSLGAEPRTLQEGLRAVGNVLKSGAFAPKQG